MGYWISKDGETVKVPDHWLFMKAKPGLFGFSKAQAKKWSLQNREGTINKALVKRWIRVRGEPPHQSFAFAIFDQNVIFNIKMFLQARNADQKEMILLEEIITDSSWYKPASWILDDDALAAARNPRRRGT